MKPEDREQIEEIIGEMKCPKDFECYKLGFKTLCKAKDIGLESFLECWEKNSQNCKFSISFGTSYFCQCPLRVYIAKKVEK